MSCVPDDHTDRMIAMTNVPMALISASEFELARDFIPELSEFKNYDDWLDYQNGRFMGCSLGGLDAKLITVSLEDFMIWCLSNQVSPSERALDEFSRQLQRRAEQGSLAA
jgi:hypothetical protein